MSYKCLTESVGITEHRTYTPTSDNVYFCIQIKRKHDMPFYIHRIQQQYNFHSQNNIYFSSIIDKNHCLINYHKNISITIDGRTIQKLN